MVNKKIKYVLYILMIISLFLSIKSKVNAQDYNVYNAVIKTNLYRAMYTGGYLDSNNGNFNTSINTINRIRVFFTTNQYFGYKDKFYLFSGYIENFGANATIIASNYYDGSSIKGACETTIYGTGQYQAFNTKCFIPDGLRNGNYNNILEFVFADNGVTPSNALDSFIYIDSNVPMIDNYYVAKNDTSNITNAINSQSQQQHQDSINTQNKLNDINNTMNDSSTDSNNMNSTFDGLNNSMASNNTISQLLLMPVRLLQKLLNAFSNRCSGINTGEIFGYELVLPCIDLESLLGSTLWSVIDVIGSGALAYAIGKKMIKIFNQFTNLKEGGLESAYD